MVTTLHITILPYCNTALCYLCSVQFCRMHKSLLFLTMINSHPVRDIQAF